MHVHLKKLYFFTYNVTIKFYYIGHPIWEFQYYGACMWYQERKTKTRNITLLKFQRCCHGEKVKLPMIDNPRTYNAMFSFTSHGMKFYTKFTKANGPPTLRLHGQTFHRIGTMLLELGHQPKYAQLYIFDTDNEVDNRMDCFRSLL